MAAFEMKFYLHGNASFYYWRNDCTFWPFLLLVFTWYHSKFERKKLLILLHCNVHEVLESLKTNLYTVFS